MLLALLFACARPVPPVAAPEPALSAALNADAVVGVASQPLRQLLSDHWEALLQHSPEFATRLGDHRYDDRLSDPSPAGVAAGWVRAEGFLARARAIDRASLLRSDIDTLDLFVADLAGSLATRECRAEQWQLSARMNPVVDINGIPENFTVTTVQDGKNLVARLNGGRAYVDGVIATSREGIAQGRTPSIESAKLVAKQVAEQLAEPVESWELMAPAALSHGWSEAEERAFARDLGAAVAGIRESYAAFATFLETELLPAARPDARAGTKFLPDGDACYAALVRRETSLELPPSEIHAIGLVELEKIHAEMRVLGGKLFGLTDLPAITARLRNDPALHFATEAEVEEKAAEALKRAEIAMPRFFGRVPVAGCVVKRVPDYEAPFTTIAYYKQPVPGEQPGEYRINVYAPTTRPRYEAEVLAWHEAIPGHHLQIAIAQELPAMPAFRRHLGTTGYVEGWALYTERLADEMGLYSGDLDRMGMLSFDTWRASRLVVDTGIHAMGWQREQAVQFMLANTALAENNIRNEVDRYISWPGQATAYKLGQIEIWKLRREAEAALGPRFNIKKFHDVVLESGAVTLPVLRLNVEAWIATSR